MYTADKGVTETETETNVFYTYAYYSTDNVLWT